MYISMQIYVCAYGTSSTTVAPCGWKRGGSGGRNTSQGGSACTRVKWMVWQRGEARASFTSVGTSHIQLCKGLCGIELLRGKKFSRSYAEERASYTRSNYASWGCWLQTNLVELCATNHKDVGNILKISKNLFSKHFQRAGSNLCK